MKNKVKIKICGIKTLEIAKVAIDSGADMLGLVFANSKRKVDIATAKLIRKNLPNAFLVGVFKNQELNDVQKIVEQVGLDIVQLHGNEPEEWQEKFTVPIFRSVAVEASGNISLDLERWRSVNAFLFDTALIDGSSGGAGKTFNWQSLQNINTQKKLIIAGGLNEKNVGVAIKILKPYAVDVSGGVEINGEKSAKLIERFIQEVRRSEKELNNA